MANSSTSTFEELLEITADHLRPIVKELRKIVLEIDPNACQVVRLGDRAITFGVGPKKMSEGYVYVLPYKSWVNLGFYKGVSLDDKTQILEGTGKKLRHVKIHSLEETENEALKTLIKLAFEERKKAFDKD